MILDSVFFVRKLNDPYNPTISATIEQVTTLLSHSNITVIHDLDRTMPTTLFVGVGGDGTMMQAMRLAIAHDSYAVGIHKGNVGFLTELTIALVTDPDSAQRDIVDALVAICDDPDKHATHRDALVVDDIDTVACNDVVVTSKNPTSILTYNLYVDGAIAGTHRANGVVISTPTGSTAYGASVGGALIVPTAPVFQIAAIAPIGLTSRPIIVSSSSSIHVDVIRGEPLVTLDGMLHELNTTYIKVRKSYRKVKVSHLESWSFFANLTNRMRWNING